MRHLLASIGENLPGYVPRSSQRKMIAEIANALSRARALPIKDSDIEDPGNDGASVLCIEGPTGTGKSIGYLLAASVMAKAMGRKLVVSSATVALQEQLVNRDIPFFVKNSGFPLNYVIAKGRTRYVCEYKLHAVSGDAVQDSMFEETQGAWDRRPEKHEIDLLAGMANDYSSGDWNGERDSLHSSVSDEMWSRVTTDRHGCLNRGCPHLKSCAQIKARDGLRGADVIVANHDLLLADLALGGGVILTAPEETFYVLDEAHHLADKAVEAFSSKHHVGAGKLMMERLAALSSKAAPILQPSDKAIAHSIQKHASGMALALGEAFDFLDSLESLKARDGKERLPVMRFPGGAAPESFHEIGVGILTPGALLGKELKSMKDALERLRDSGSVDPAIIEKLIADFGFYTGRAEIVFKTWRLLLSEPAANQPPVAKWVATELVRGSKRFDYEVNASPTMAGAALVKMLWKRASGAVLTSATLTATGSFDKLLADTGLKRLPETKCVRLDSPFDFANQGVLVVPDMRTTPKDAAAHTLEVIEMLPQIIADDQACGTLVLFSSRKMMEEVSAALPSSLAKLLLVQGNGSKSDLLKAHHERIGQGKHSVLFGLASFAEGLDLPGNACTHVIVAKLPFAVPDDPVHKTLSEWIEERGGNPFMEITVPMAALRLTQAVGRLIRTESDTGMVTILDKRIETTRYGKLMLKGLPPFKVVVFGKEKRA